jgi:hypothetical protein
MTVSIHDEESGKMQAAYQAISQPATAVSCPGGGTASSTSRHSNFDFSLKRLADFLSCMLDYCHFLGGGAL